MHSDNHNLGFRDIAVLSLLFVLLFFSFPASASEHEGRTGRAGGATETVVSADLAGQENPKGLVLSVGAYRRWVHDRDRELGVPSSYLQAGVGALTSPGYGRVSAHGEWLPVIFAKLRVQYDVYRYYGNYAALLSFPSADAKFGREEIAAREGTEETGHGTRVLIRPTLMAKAGRVVITNQTDVAYFRFSGRGPYYLEWTYETLMKNGDQVIENRTNLLFEAWRGPGGAFLLTGPYYEIMRASADNLDRVRSGIMVFWEPRPAPVMQYRPRFYAQVGWYLRDPNRDGTMTAAAGMGFDLDW
jgi:hypothetical protein